MSGERFMDASLVENLVFKNNTFRKNDSLPTHPEIAPNGIRVENCVNAEVEDCIRVP